MFTTDGEDLWVAVEDEAARILYRSTDQGRTWNLASRGLPAAARVTALMTDSHGLLLGTRARGLFRSTDRGATWHALESNVLQHEGLSALVRWNELLFAGTHAAGIYCSADGGHSWRAVNCGLPLEGRGLGILALASTRNEVVVSHTFGLHRVEKAAWTFASTGLPPGAVFPWIGTSRGLLITGGATGLYLSTDGGASWTHVFPPRSSPLLTTSLAVSRGTIIVGTMHPSRGSGIYASTDGGSTWCPLCDGLPDALTPLFLAPFRGGVAVGTRDQGVWISPLDETEHVAPAMLPLVLQQNEPNPFSGTTTISYVLRRAGTVRLDVCDVAGCEVARLVDTHQAAGAYAVTFDGGHLDGGFYTCQLAVGDLSQTRQMLLMK